MYKDQKVIVVMPAYNAAQTLRKTWDEVMAQEIVDLLVLFDGDMGMSHENMCFTTS